jgi:hypothetical protein
MTDFDYSAGAQLYLGCDRQTAFAQGPRAFRHAAAALRFAFEEAAPVSLRGAALVVGDKTYSGAGLAALYHGAGYPLPRKHRLNGMPRRHPAIQRSLKWQVSIMTQWPNSTRAGATPSRRRPSIAASASPLMQFAT